MHNSISGSVQCANQVRDIDSWPQLTHAIDRNQLGRNAPSLGETVTSLQFAHLIIGVSELNTANSLQQPVILPAGVKFVQFIKRTLGQVRHRFRGVDLKHESWSMRGRTTRLIQWSLINYGDITRATLGELIRYCCPNNARSDNKNF